MSRRTGGTSRSTLRGDVAGNVLSLNARLDWARRASVSSATVNCELRTVKAVLKYAVRWKYLEKLPNIYFLKEPDQTKPFVSQAHFQLMYHHCHAAKKPNHLPYEAEQWWKALLVSICLVGGSTNTTSPATCTVFMTYGVDSRRSPD